jgi:hypothetical protein
MQSLSIKDHQPDKRLLIFWRIAVKLKKMILVLMLSPLVAIAGQAERDFISTQVDPAVKDAASTLKKSCGCDVKFNIKFDTFKDTSELMKIKYFANTIKENAGPYCKDAASKAAVCKLKTVEFSKSNNADFKFSGGKGIATSDSSAHPSWDMIVREVDK